MILEITSNPSKIDLYLVNQLVDIALWSWILLIMIKRTICRGFNLTPHSIVTSIKQRSLLHLLKEKFGMLVKQHHYYSDVLLLLASLLAVIQFSNQYYFHTTHFTNDIPNILSRTYPWMIFHKLLTTSILFKYRKSQPKVFTELAEEIKQFKIWN